MKLLIEVANQDEFSELLKELQWQERNGKLEDTLDGYQAAADDLRGMAARGRMEGQAIERDRCAKICEDYAAALSGDGCNAALACAAMIRKGRGGGMKYHTNSVPPFYKCSACGVSGVKLWRQYSVCADYVRLLCAPCGCADQKIEDNVDDQGNGQCCDQLNSLVPAVPTEDEHTYWGYTSVPEEGVQWWKRLPTRIRGEK